MTIRIIALQMILLIFAMQSTFAQATYTCSGPVTGVAINPGGFVVPGSMGGFNWVYVCQLGTNYNGVTPEACKAIYATLLIAQMSGKHVMLWFDDGGNCASHSAWAPLQGWYFGPQLMP